MAVKAEAPWLARPGLGGIVDPDAGRGHDRRHVPDRAGFGRHLESERGDRVAQIAPCPARVQAEGRGQEPRPACQSRGRDPIDPLAVGHRALGRRRAAPGDRPGEPIRAHALDALERLDGADQKGGRGAGRFRDHVQAGMHPVDKVHVGVSGRPEHDPVPGGLAKAGVRSEVLAADVRLDLDDPPDTPTGVVVTDESGTQKGSTGLERRTREQLAVEDAWSGQRNG